MKLSERKHEILIATVEDYIKEASPITSSSVKERHLKNLSSATLRVELNALEAMGFLKQLHTSSGRIPTSEGYRYYVEWLLKDFKLEPAKIERVGEILSERTKSISELVSELAKVISETTNCPTVVMMNSFNNLVIEEIKIVPLVGESALLLIKTPSGFVNSTIKTSANVKSCEDAGRLLTKKFYGQTIGYLAENILNVEKEINKEVSDYKLLVGSLIDGLKQLSEKRTVGVKGNVKLLESKEEKEVNVAKKTYEILEDEEKLETILETDNDDLSFGFSDENEEFGGVAVVKAPLVISGKHVGSIGVLGPERMDYMLIASAIKFLTNELENIDMLEDKKWVKIAKKI